VQPDIVKMGGVTGLLRSAALAHAHGVELVPHQTQPAIGHTANLHLAASLLHMTKPCEWNDPSARQHAVFDNPPKPVNGLLHLSSEPGLGLHINEARACQETRPNRMKPPAALPPAPYCLSMFQNTSKAACSTPVTLLRQAKGCVYWPTGMSGNACHSWRDSASSAA
jgi:hypothetical protein